MEPSYACEILRELIPRVVTTMSSCQGNTSSRWEIKQLEISFFLVFSFFPMKVARGHVHSSRGGIHGPRLLMTALVDTSSFDIPLSKTRRYFRLNDIKYLESKSNLFRQTNIPDLRWMEIIRNRRVLCVVLEQPPTWKEMESRLGSCNITFVDTICPKIWAKPQSKNGKSTRFFQDSNPGHICEASCCLSHPLSPVSLNCGKLTF